MDTQDPPIRPRYQLTRGLIGLDNEKDAMTSRCLDRKEVRHATLRAHTGTGTLVGALCTHIRRLFLSFGATHFSSYYSAIQRATVLQFHYVVDLPKVGK